MRLFFHFLLLPMLLISALEVEVEVPNGNWTIGAIAGCDKDMACVFPKLVGCCMKTLSTASCVKETVGFIWDHCPTRVCKAVILYLQNEWETSGVPRDPEEGKDCQLQKTGKNVTILVTTATESSRTTVTTTEMSSSPELSKVQTTTTATSSRTKASSKISTIVVSSKTTKKTISTEITTFSSSSHGTLFPPRPMPLEDISTSTQPLEDTSTSAQPPPVKEEKSQTYIIVTGVIAAVGVLLAAVVAVLVFRWRKKRKQKKRKEPKKKKKEFKWPKTTNNRELPEASDTRSVEMQPWEIESGQVTKENYKFLGPITIEAGQKKDVPLRHATDGQKSHSLKTVRIDSRLNVCVDIGTEVENLETDSQAEKIIVLTDNDNTLVPNSQLMTETDILKTGRSEDWEKKPKTDVTKTSLQKTQQNTSIA